MPTPLELLEWVAVASTVINVALVMRANIWAFLPGVIASLGYGVFFYLNKYYGNAALFMVYFLPMQAYGFWIWRTRGPAQDDDLPLKSGSAGTYLGALAAGAVAAVPLQLLLKAIDGTSAALDAFTTGISVVAQLLLSHKRAESWMLWVLADVVYTVMFIKGGLWPSAALYALLTLMALKGWRDWTLAAHEGRAQVG